MNKEPYTSEEEMQGFLDTQPDDLGEYGRKEKEEKLPEAPASANLQVNIEGYSMQFTMRDRSEDMLIKRVKRMIAVFNAMGAKPEVKRSFGDKKEKEYSANKCPVCGARVVISTTKTGKKIEQCENRKYDYITKQTTGCSYVHWVDDATSAIAEKKENTEEPATEAQERVLKSQGLWMDRLTKMQAMKLIQESMQK